MGGTNLSPTTHHPPYTTHVWPTLPTLFVFHAKRPSRKLQLQRKSNFWPEKRQTFHWRSPLLHISPAEQLSSWARGKLTRENTESRREGRDSNPLNTLTRKIRGKICEEIIGNCINPFFMFAHKLPGQVQHAACGRVWYLTSASFIRGSSLPHTPPAARCPLPASHLPLHLAFKHLLN